MRKRIEERLEQYISTLLEKESLTAEEYHVLVSEAMRQKSLEDNERSELQRIEQTRRMRELLEATFQE